MNLDFIVKLLEENGDFNLKGKCIDCGKETTIAVLRTDDSQILIEGGAVFNPPESYGYDSKTVCKCDACFIIDPKVHQRTEVYTRVVGYLRPMNQMNPGKLSEVNQRVMFNI